ncbi:MAG: polyphosphate polymerase domain-containing protein [Lachnospiraceae bacterium]|nr:polyphosphate polymerase domain-containing protein [Lachnospiraceae bacterium]
MGDTFQRVEIKYLMNTAKKEAFLRLVREHVKPDDYGVYTVQNIYFDTDHFDLVRRSMEKPVYKEKLRLRSYGTPDMNSKVFLEIKKKYKGIVYKRRTDFPLSEAYDYIKGRIRPAGLNPQIFREIDYFMQYYDPKPAVVLCYDRVAYVGTEDPDFRLTIDTNIRSRDTDLRLENGSYGEMLFDQPMFLMEIKAMGAMPRWLVKALSQLQIYPVSFSKYGRVYQKERERGQLAC